MVKTFSGYARQRGFKSSEVSPRIKQDQQYVRSVEQARKLDNQNAVDVHNSLQERFAIDQNTRQTYLDIETRAAALERKAKEEQFEAEIAKADAEAKDRTDIYKSLANISATAASTLAKEVVKRNEAKLNLSKNLVVQYGLTHEEVTQLQAMEGGLDDFENSQAPLIHKLRDFGASESDISVLMKKSGWSSYGAALGVVQQAGKGYDSYLTSKYTEDVLIAGVPMSLATAESQGDVAAIAGIYDRHRMNYFQEYLPGYDPAFIAKHAREPMQQAESRRKRNMATRMEETARTGNYAKEKDNLAIKLNGNFTDPQIFIADVLQQAGGLDSSILGTVHNRKVKQVAELIENDVVSPRVGEGILNSTVFAKHLNREATYAEAFPVQTGIIKEAIQKSDDERRRITWNATQDEKRRGTQLADAVIREFALNPEQKTTENIQGAVRAVLETGNLDAANKVAKLLEFSTEKINDREFDNYWTKQKVLGNYPTPEDILFGGLSNSKINSEMQQRKEVEDIGLNKEVVSNIDNRIKSLLTTALGDAYGNTQKRLPESYYAAFSAAKKQALIDFRVAYKGPETSTEAENYAIGELQKELDKENGQYKVNESGATTKTDKRGRTIPIFDPGFTNFMGVEPVKKESSLPAIVDAHKNGVEAFRTELFIDSGRVKNMVTKLNNGIGQSFPSEFHSINKALNGNSSLSEIASAQIEQARKQDPSIPELKPEVKSIFQKAENVLPPNILNTIQRYNTPATVDRGLVQSNIPSIYDRSDPYVSFGRMIESTGKVRPDLIPTFLAVLAGESGFNPTIDTAQSGLDPLKRNEFSIGLLQVNTQAHMDKLRRLGYTMDDLRNPVKNLEVAMLVYDEWIQVRMKKFGDTLEEAQVNALDRWGAYSDGSYLTHLTSAVSDWTKYKEQASLPVWQQSCNMNAQAKAWCDKNPGRWN